jgi:hypothetical protein
MTNLAHLSFFSPPSLCALCQSHTCALPAPQELCEDGLMMTVDHLPFCLCPLTLWQC